MMMSIEQESPIIPDIQKELSEGNELSYEDIHQATLRALEHFEAEERRPGVTPEGREDLERKKAMVTRESQEVGGVFRTLGAGKLGRMLLFAMGGLSMIAAKGEFTPVEGAQETPPPQRIEEELAIEEKQAPAPEIHAPRSLEEAEQMLKELQEGLEIFKGVAEELKRFNEVTDTFTRALDNASKKQEMIEKMIQHLQELSNEERKISPINEVPQLPNSPDQG